MRNYVSIICALCVMSCTNSRKEESKILNVGSGNDVTVTLTIKENTNIEKIEFYSGSDSVTIGKKDIELHDEFIYKFENKGEGTFTTCIFKLNDTICAVDYVEEGYRPKMEFVNDSLKMTYFSELNYE